MSPLKTIDEILLNTTTSAWLGRVIGWPRYVTKRQYRLTFSYCILQEIIKRQQFGSKVDIWSLGCVMYELIAQEPPYHSLGPLMVRIDCIANPPGDYP